MKGKVGLALVACLCMGAMTVVAGPIDYIEKWDTYANGFDGTDYTANWPPDPGPNRYEVGEFGGNVFSGTKSLKVRKGQTIGITHDLTMDAMSAGEWVESGTGTDALTAMIYIDFNTTAATRNVTDAFLEVSKGGAHAPDSGGNAEVIAFGMTYGINGASTSPWVYDGSSWQQATGVLTDKRWNIFKLTITPTELTLEGLQKASGSHNFTNNSGNQFDHLSVRTVSNDGQTRYIDDVVLQGGVIVPEPNMLLLLAVGGLSLLLFLWRRRKQPA